MRSEKQLLLDEIKDKIVGSKAFVITRYTSMRANLNADFRSCIIEAGGDYEVVKKRVLKKAAEAAGIPVDLKTLEGHIAIVFAKNDPVKVTKAIFKFSDENKEQLAFLGGRFEGASCSSSDLVQISNLPDKDQMRAQFLSLLEAPASHFLGVVDALLTSVVHCLNGKVEQEEKNS